MKINKKISKYNNSSRNGNQIKYIVVHWVGAVSTAKNNVDYFSRGDRQASAHCFVDDNSVWQSVEFSRAAWHCGGGRQGTGGAGLLGVCKNSNSIGIEMCCKRKNGKLYISDSTIDRTGQLVRYLMKAYNIKASRVVRHYDVTGKKCPGGYTSSSAWSGLRARLTGNASSMPKSYTGAWPTWTVGIGMGTRDNVKRWQAFLCWFGPDVVKDGIFGKDTKSKTVSFQKSKGLVCDGIAGPKTYAAARKHRK